MRNVKSHQSLVIYGKKEIMDSTATGEKGEEKTINTQLEENNTAQFNTLYFTPQYESCACCPLQNTILGNSL